jgi:Ca2+:H+ antiporter
MSASALFAPKNLLNWLYLAIPVAIYCEVTHQNAIAIFIASAISIIPLAGLMGKATEHLSEKLGEGLGGLLNATFGNAAELIIALMALKKGLIPVVKASITGSIIGNILLVLGLSAVCGGLKHRTQKFNLTAASMGSTLLALAGIALVLPAVFHFIGGTQAIKVERDVSLEISIVLFITYILSLIFSLRTHSHLYVGDGGKEEEVALETEHWSQKKSFLILLGATSAVAVMSEFLVGAVEVASHSLGLTQVFVGVILVAIIGNAAEHSTAVLVALKNKMGLAMNIAVGSSLQVALFVAPVLVFAGYAMGQPMDLIFTPMEVVAVAVAVTVTALICQDGETNWMEGALLLAVYVILGIVFYWLPEALPQALPQAQH